MLRFFFNVPTTYDRQYVSFMYVSYFWPRIVFASFFFNNYSYRYRSLPVPVERRAGREQTNKRTNEQTNEPTNQRTTTNNDFRKERAYIGSSKCYGNYHHSSRLDNSLITLDHYRNYNKKTTTSNLAGLLLLPLLLEVVVVVV
jgi:hypothetical protein